jgi:hypothetical protein
MDDAARVRRHGVTPAHFPHIGPHGRELHAAAVHAQLAVVVPGKAQQAAMRTGCASGAASTAALPGVAPRCAWLWGVRRLHVVMSRSSARHSMKLHARTHKEACINADIACALLNVAHALRSLVSLLQHQKKLLAASAFSAAAHNSLRLVRSFMLRVHREVAQRAVGANCRQQSLARKHLANGMATTAHQALQVRVAR